MRATITLVVLACLGTLAGCSQPDDVTPGDPQHETPYPGTDDGETVLPAPLAALDEGWNSIAPGGDTVCSDGSDYRFFVRVADPKKLVVYFQGGGACWNGVNCDPHLDPSYKQTVADDEPERYDGIFAFDNPENPFADYSVVMAPYCSADVHLGNEVATYQAPAREAREGEDGEMLPAHEAHEVTIRHKGLVNARAVLDWTYDSFRAPEEIFVTGSSAGAIPSPYYAWKIADAYPEARIAQLGDGAGGYRRDDTATNPMSEWNTLDHFQQYPEFEGMTAEDLAYEDLYIAAAKRHPDILFTEYDAAEDAVQKRFLAMSGSQTKQLIESLEANHNDIRAAVDNFRAYVAGGDSHTILARPEFYTFQVDGRRIRDWVADLADFETVENVMCDHCDEAEVLGEGQPSGS